MREATSLPRLCDAELVELAFPQTLAGSVVDSRLCVLVPGSTAACGAHREPAAVWPEGPEHGGGSDTLKGESAAGEQV